MALFSAAASGAARMYIEKRRRAYLYQSIMENQKNVTVYSDHCISLLHTIRGGIKRYYYDRVEPIRISWNRSSWAKRLKHTAAMVDLNEQFGDVMRTLEELEYAYSVLPVAHDNLATAVYHTKFSAEGIQRLHSSAKRLQSLYNEMKETEEKE